jgi:hypothetical protein
MPWDLSRRWLIMPVSFSLPMISRNCCRASSALPLLHAASHPRNPGPVRLPARATAPFEVRVRVFAD